MLSLVLGHYVSPCWYLFTAFVGLKSVSVWIHELVPDDDVPT